MNANIKFPNLTLERYQYFADCTLGQLLNDEEEVICQTMEPPCRKKGERVIVSQTAIPDGIYPVTMEFDDVLHYCNFHVRAGRTFKNVRLCFLSKSEATPNQLNGSILMGMCVDTAEGCLKDCASAFAKLRGYFERKRCNREELRLQVISKGFKERLRQNFCQKPVIAEPALEDYELETLD